MSRARPLVYMLCLCVVFVFCVENESDNGYQKADILRLLSFPTEAAAGRVWPVQPVVEAAMRMADGQLVRDASIHNIAVRVRIATINGSSVIGWQSKYTLLAGQRDVYATMVFGRATFSNLSINGGDVSYVLEFSMKNRDAIRSPQLTLTLGTPSKAVFHRVPAGAIAGDAFTVQPMIALLEDGGNVVEADCNATATLRSGVTLHGDTTATCEKGYVRFTNLQINLAPLEDILEVHIDSRGTGFTTTVASKVISVVGPPRQLSISNAPEVAFGGVELDTSPVVIVMDKAGNLVMDEHLIGAYLHDGHAHSLQAAVPSHVWLQASVVSGFDTVAISATPAGEASTGAGTEDGLPMNGEQVELRDFSPDCFAASKKTDDELCRGLVQAVKHVSRGKAGTKIVLDHPWQHRSSTTIKLRRIKYSLIRPTKDGAATFERLTILQSQTAVLGFVLLEKDEVPPLPYTYAFRPENFIADRCSSRPDRCGTIVTSQTAPFIVQSSAPAQLTFSPSPSGCDDDNTPCSIQPRVVLRDAGGNRVAYHGNLEVRLVTPSLLEGTDRCYLSGQAASRMYGGIAIFTGVSLSTFGQSKNCNCKLFAQAHVPGSGFLEAEAVISVKTSPWSLLKPFNNSVLEPVPFSGQRFGHQVAASTSFVVSAAPFDLSTSETDVFVELLADAQRLPEVQQVDITASWSPERQLVTIARQRNESWPHAFRLSFASELWTRWISTEASAEYLQTVITEDIPLIQADMDSIRVSELADDQLTSGNNNTADGTSTRCFLVQIFGVYGTVPQLAGEMRHSGDQLSVEQLDAATVIVGSFSLGLPLSDANSGREPPQAIWSRSFSVLTDVAELERMLRIDLALPFLTVDEVLPSDELGFFQQMNQRRLRLTLEHSEIFSFPLMLGNDSSLSGGKVGLVVRRLQSGTGPLSGSFRICIDGEPSQPVHVHGSALDTVNALSGTTPNFVVDANVVLRNRAAGVEHIVWQLTFWRIPVYANVAAPPRAPNVTVAYKLCRYNIATGCASEELVGSGVSISVRTAIEPSRRSSPTFSESMVPQLGETGSAYVFKRGNAGRALPFQRIYMEDADYARFGASLALDETTNFAVLGVGAPFASRRAHSAILQLRCRAEAGYFTIAHPSFPLRHAPYNMSGRAFADLLSTFIVGIHVSHDEALTGALCNQTGRVSSFHVISELSQWWRAFSVIDDHLHGEASLQLVDDRQEDPFFDGEKMGTVILYSWSPGASRFVVRHRLRPESVTVKFGDAVAVRCNSGGGNAVTVAVGAPGTVLGGQGNAGSVTMYTWVSPDEFVNPWSSPITQTLQLLDDFSSFSEWRFGSTVALAKEGDTVAVSAPGYDMGSGAVFIYKRQQNPTALFFLDQVIENPDSAATQFGFSLSFDESHLAVGAPGALSAARTDEATGAVFIYQRKGWGEEGGYLTLEERLVPGNASHGDAAGFAVAVVGDIVSFSSLRLESQSYLSNAERTYLARDLSIGVSTARVQEIQVVQEPGFGDVFKLAWSTTQAEVSLNFSSSASEMEEVLHTLTSGETDTVSLLPAASASTRIWAVTFRGATMGALVLVGGLPGLIHDTGTQQLASYGLVHFFTRQNLRWIEDGASAAGARPDTFGFSIAMPTDGSLLVVGSPTDTIFSTNTQSLPNSGAVSLLDLSIFNFTLKPRSVDEILDVAESMPSVDVPISCWKPRGASCSVLPPYVSAALIDGNAIANCARNPRDKASFASSLTSPANGDDRHGEFTCGSTIVPDFQSSAAMNVTDASIKIILSDDPLPESPVEYFHLTISAPRFIPSFVGRFWLPIRIRDNDGMGRARTVEDFHQSVCGLEFGSALATSGQASFALYLVDESSACTKEAGAPYLAALILDSAHHPVHAFHIKIGNLQIKAQERSEITAAQLNSSEVYPSYLVTISFPSSCTFINVHCALGGDQSICVVLSTQVTCGNAYGDATKLPVSSCGAKGSLAMSASRGVNATLVAGCPASGQVAIYEWNKSKLMWDLLGVFTTMDLGTPTVRVGFGYQVDADGETIVVGSPADYSNAGIDGVVYVFHLIHSFSFSTWRHMLGRKDGTWAFAANWPEGDGLTESQVRARVVDLPPTDCLVLIATINDPSKYANPSFGSSIAFSGATLVVGAPEAVYAPQITWDFETGDILGWAAYGTAFSMQPIAVQKHWENCSITEQGNAPKQYSGAYLIDSHGGLHDCGAHVTVINQAVGYMVSDGFLVEGSMIRFLVGGGCDSELLYVQLLIDGEEAAFATGPCSSDMRWIVWNTTDYQGRTARLRIVDESTAGRIFVDNIQFDWDVSKQRHYSGAVYVFSRVSGNIQQEDEREWPSSASVYFDNVLSRPGFVNSSSNDASVRLVRAPQWHECKNASEDGCAWNYVTRLLPDILQPDSLFGAAVAYDAVSGALTISSAGKRSHLRPTAPHDRNNLGRSVIKVLASARGGSSSAMTELRPSREMFGGGILNSLDQASGSSFAFSAQRRTAFRVPSISQCEGTETTLTIYFQVPHKYGGDGQVVSPPTWPSVPRVKLTFPTDVRSSNMKPSSFGLVVGLPKTFASGCVEHLDLSGLYLSPKKADWTSPAEQHERLIEFRARPRPIGQINGAYYVTRGDSYIEVPLYRKGRDTQRDMRYPASFLRNTTLRLSYFTVDVTAIGVAESLGESCRRLHPSMRVVHGCGDYIHARGVVEVGMHQEAASIRVNLLDHEPPIAKSRVFTIQLALESGISIWGGDYSISVWINGA